MGFLTCAARGALFTALALRTRGARTRRGVIGSTSWNAFSQSLVPQSLLGPSLVQSYAVMPPYACRLLGVRVKSFFLGVRVSLSSKILCLKPKISRRVLPTLPIV